jgi:hypothetical protein
MCETGIEMELEIYATNLANKTKCMSTKAKKKMQKYLKPVILSVVHHHHNPFGIIRVG